MSFISRRKVCRRGMALLPAFALGLILGAADLPSPFAPQPVMAGDAVSLALKFREGQILKYGYSETVNYTPPTKFAGTTGYELSVKTEYKITVARVLSDNSASVKLAFERIAVFKDGTPICDLSVFPKQVEGISGTIKPNGETTWYKNIYLTINKSGKLEFRVGTGGGSIATGTLSTTGSEKNQLEADLDEGEGVIKIGVPPTRTLETPDHGKLVEFKVDLTPRKVFEFLLLPTLPLSEGQSFSTSVKYLGQEKLLYKGQVDSGGYQGNMVSIDVTPWSEAAGDGVVGLQPAVSGNMSYTIDNLGKLVYMSGKLHSEVIIPEVGTQAANSTIELQIRK